jgi:nitrous oxide reductase accessory protein NosL
VHQRLTTPLANPGAITLFHGKPNEHLALAKHLTAEVKTEEFVTGKGVVTKWEKRNKHNHWFDALYNACVAGHYCGVRLVEEPPKPKQRMSLAEMAARARWKDAPTARELAEQANRPTSLRGMAEKARKNG